MSFLPRRIALSALVALALAALSTQQADAHGKLLSPEARIRPASGIVEAQQYDFVGEIKGKDVFPPARGQSWGSTPQKNQQLFQTTFTAKGFTTLRQFFQTVDKNMKPRFPGKTDNTCGFTGVDSDPVALPADGVIEWGNKAGKWGFQDNHHGPCELWCDDTLVLQNADCRGAFGKELPARMKIDVAQCAGAKRLQFLWLAVHFANWQYWLNCVPLVASVPSVPSVPMPSGASGVMPVANATDAVAMPSPSSSPSLSPSPAVAAPPPVVVATETPMAVPASVAPVAPVAPVPVSQPFDAIKQQDPLASVMAAPVTDAIGGAPLTAVAPDTGAAPSAVATSNKRMYAQYA